MAEGDDSRDWMAQLRSEPSPLLVVFGGIAQGFGMPPFEFENLVGELGPCNLILLRDRHQCWYQAGVEGLGVSPDSVSHALGEMIESISPTRVVMTGNSSGGFAALQAASALPGGVQEVHLFSPQSNLQAEWRDRIGDRRWPEEVAATHELVGSNAPSLDLVGSLSGVPLARTTVHFPLFNRPDRRHAGHLARLRNVRLRPYASRRHGLVKRLRQAGRLAPILTAALWSQRSDA